MTMGMLEDYFENVFRGMCQSVETDAYVVGVMSRPENLSNESVVLNWIAASANSDFARTVAIGDWVLWAAVWAQNHLYQKDAAIIIGQMAYSRCHRMTREKWYVFEELSCRLPVIVSDARRRLSAVQIALE